MRIYWDRVLVADAAAIDERQIRRLDPATATLRARGFSADRKSVV